MKPDLGKQYDGPFGCAPSTLHRTSRVPAGMGFYRTGVRSMMGGQPKSSEPGSVCGAPGSDQEDES